MSAEFDDGKDDGALRTIGEVSKALSIRTHVLRYWEQQFPMLEPLKRSGGRRYYRPADVQLVERIDYLVNDQGYTLKGAKQVIEEEGRASSGEEAEDQTRSEPLPVSSIVGDTPLASDGGLASFFAPAEPSEATSDQPDEVPFESSVEDGSPGIVHALPADEIVARLRSIRRKLAQAIDA